MLRQKADEVLIYRRFFTEEDMSKAIQALDNEDLTELKSLLKIVVNRTVKSMGVTNSQPKKGEK